jgi:hypothetical protein
MAKLKQRKTVLFVQIRSRLLSETVQDRQPAARSVLAIGMLFKVLTLGLPWG